MCASVFMQITMVTLEKIHIYASECVHVNCEGESLKDTYFVRKCVHVNKG